MHSGIIQPNRFRFIVQSMVQSMIHGPGFEVLPSSFLASFLIRHPDYSKKKITIFKGKLWADRVQITDDEIKSAGYTRTV